MTLKTKTTRTAPSTARPRAMQAAGATAAGKAPPAPTAALARTMQRVRAIPMGRGAGSRARDVRAMHGTLGARRTAQLMRKGQGDEAMRVQPKLEVGPPNDAYEREADATAQRVMRMGGGACCPSCAEGGECEVSPTRIRRMAGDESAGMPVPAELEPRIQKMQRGGEPLPDQVRAQMEPRFGQDLSNVRIHRDAEAVNTAQALDAKAYTLGSHIAFNTGQYAPGTTSGDHLIAHELTHVAQQGRAGQLRRIQRRGENEPAAAGEDRDIDEIVEVTGSEPSPGSGAGGGAETAEVEPPEIPAEIEIPTFDTGDDEPCPQLIPSEPLIREGGPEGAGEKESEGSGGFIDELLSLAPLPFMGIGLAVRGARWAWGQLPLSVRAAAINKAIDLAISGVKFVPRFAALGVGIVATWILAGLEAFLKRLKREDDARKVRLFEKYLEIISGHSASFIWAYLKGLLQGFFVDGLIGIIQTIVDIVCLVGKFPKLIDALKKFFGVFPEEMMNVANAIVILHMTIAAAIQGIGGEVKEFLSSPQKILSLFETVVEAGASVSSMVGEKVAEGLIQFMELPPAKMGKAVGRLAGMAAFEIVLTVLTAGGGAAVTGAKLLVRSAIKLMAMVGKQLLRILKFVGSVLKMLVPYVVKARQFLTPLLKNVASSLQHALTSIDDLIVALLNRCRPGSVKCRISKRQRRRRRRQRSRAGKIDWSDNPRSREYGHSASEHGPKARSDQGMWSVARQDGIPKGRFFDEGSIIEAERATRGKNGWKHGGHYLQEVEIRNVGEVFLPDGTTKVTTHVVRIVREGSNPYGRVVTSYPVLTDTLKKRLRRRGVPIAR